MAQNRYITVAELATYHDSRALSELGSDTGTPGVVDETNPILLNAIDTSSAAVESYALKSERYTLQDLLDLQADDNWTLKELVASLAVARLYRRRGGDVPPEAAQAERASNQVLEELRNGMQVFNDDGAKTSGNTSVKIVSTAEGARARLVSASGFFPARTGNQI